MLKFLSMQLLVFLLLKTILASTSRISTLLHYVDTQVGVTPGNMIIVEIKKISRRAAKDFSK